MALLALSVQRPTDWVVAYDGGGSVTFENSSISSNEPAQSLNRPTILGVASTGETTATASPALIHLKPKSAQSLDQTHAALVLSKLRNIKYFELELTFKNVAPLRLGPANPWETFWLFFNYQPEGSFKRTNYVAFKTNGLEAGIATGDREQKILKTWQEPISAYGARTHLKFKRMGTRISIQLNEEEPVIYDFAKDAEKPLAQPGAIGLYSEDADVVVESLSIKSI